MPPINKYKCTKCSFSFPDRWGGHFYIIDEKMERKIVPHPGEEFVVRDILGNNYSEKDYIKRTGFNSFCACKDCHSQFAFDLGIDEKENIWREYYNSLQKKDERICPNCNLKNIVTVFESINKKW